MQLPHMMPAGKRGKLILSQFLCETGSKSYFRHGGKVPSPSGCRQLWGDLAPVHLGERISAVLMSVYTSCCWKKRVQSMHHSPLLHPCILWGELIKWLHPGSSCELHSCATTLETSSTTAWVNTLFCPFCGVERWGVSFLTLLWLSYTTQNTLSGVQAVTYICTITFTIYNLL